MVLKQKIDCFLKSISCFVTYQNTPFKNSFQTFSKNLSVNNRLFRQNCSGRLTWDVFVRNLARQLGTPSLWLPMDTCKEGQKGALAAVCTPTLKSASKKHQKLCTSISEHREWHSEGGKRNCVLCIFSPSGKQPFSSPLCVASRLEQATRVYSGKICQKFEPRFQHPRFYLNDSSI